MKKGAFYFIFVLLGSFFIFQNSFSANSDIVINEIGAYESTGHEWIEIWNKGSEVVDISGWKFWENNTNHSLAASTTDAVVQSGEYAAIVQDALQFMLDYPNFTGSVFDSSWGSLNESGEAIGLKDNSGEFVEQFLYISAPHFSLQRRDPFLSDYTMLNWAEHGAGNTVGSVNVFAVSSTDQQATTTSTDVVQPEVSQNQTGGVSSSDVFQPTYNITYIKINEFVSDPQDGNEWVELYNTSDASLGLAGAIICDNRASTSTCKKLNIIIGPHSWVQVDLQTKSFLNNAGDSVVLRDVMGTVVDRIDYVDDLVPDQGQSLVRKVDGQDTDDDADWSVTDSITPGAANNISTSSEILPASSTTKTVVKKTPAVFVWNISAPSTASPGEAIVCNAEDTADPRGGRLSFIWTLESGQQFIGPELQVSFVSSGVHNIDLFVTSTSGYGEVKKISIVVGEGLSQSADVILSEIFPNPEGQDSKEFIEIYNNASTSVNIGGWFIKVGDKKFSFLENTIIPPVGTLVFYKSVTKISLVNTVGKVELYNKDKALVDLVKYEKAVSGKSYAFTQGEWRWLDPSPGNNTSTIGVEVKNKITNVSTTKKVRITNASPVTDIASVREAAKGRSARITGIVSVVPGVFGSQYFYLNTETAGIQIFQSKKDFPPLGVGDKVEIQGTVSEANGIKRINIKNNKSVDILSLHNIVPVLDISLAEFDTQYLGAVVRVEGEVTDVKSNFLYIDDGEGEVKVYFKKNAHIEKQTVTEGDKAAVIGVLEHVGGEWQIWPRMTGDIELMPKQTEAVLGEKISAPENPVKKYIIATAGALVAFVAAFLVKFKGLRMLEWLSQRLKKE